MRSDGRSQAPLQRRFADAAALLAGFLLLSGCDPSKQPPVQSFQDVATVRVAGLSISRWEEYAERLQPNFNLSSEKALEAALPKTYISNRKSSELQNAGLRIGLQQSTRTSNTTKTETTENGASNQNSTRTKTSEIKPGTLPSGTLPETNLPDIEKVVLPSGTIKYDPILHYTAAAAIYQEVAVLDGYVKDAALRYDFVPYLVVLQISVGPLARHQPYDVYADLGFFSHCSIKHASDKHASDDVKPAIAIPLLVTDDVETGEAANARDEAHQRGLGIGGIVNNAALQADLSDLKRKANGLLGSELNSLYMVGRATDNVIQVRLGASRNPDPDIGYGMVPQTHKVGVLVLVARDHSPEAGKCAKAPQLWINEFSTLRNAKTGQELEIDKRVILEHAQRVLARFDSRTKKTDIGDLIFAVQDNNIKELEDAFCKVDPSHCHSKGYLQSLWTALASVIDMSDYDATIIDLPKLDRPHIDLSQAIVLEDTCGDESTITVGGFGDLSPKRFAATLDLGHGVLLVANRIEVENEGQGVLEAFVFHFPSLRILKDGLGSKCATASKEKNGAPPMDVGKLRDAKLTIKRISRQKWGGESDLKKEYELRNIYYTVKMDSFIRKNDNKK